MIMKPEEIFKHSKTKNISAEGICFESNEKLEEALYVNLEVDLLDSKSPVRLVGEIRWSSKIKTKDPKETRHLNGVKLIDIAKSDEGRFLKYYCDKMVEKLAYYLKM